MFVLGKEILNILITSSQLYLVFWSIYSILGPEKKLFLLLLWAVVGGRVGYQALQEFCCVWLELVCHKCFGQSGIWTSLDGKLWWLQGVNMPRYQGVMIPRCPRHQGSQCVNLSRYQGVKVSSFWRYQGSQGGKVPMWRDVKVTRCSHRGKGGEIRMMIVKGLC